MIALNGHLLLTAALAVATMTLWATGRIPEFLAGLMFFATAMITQVAPASVVFSGFSSAAFWLIVSGYVIGGAIRKTGLAERGALLLGPHLCRSYPRMVAGVIGLTYLLAFVMPSNLGRIALLMPIVLALADRAGLSKGRPGRIGLALAVGFGTFQLSASILPANVPNLVLVGAVEQNFGIRLTYLSYFLLHAPVLGLLKGIVLIACIAWLFHDRPKPTLQDLPDSSLSPAEKRLAMLLAATLGLWLTDRYHGISAAWIGLAAACLCLMPKIGFVTGEEFSKEVNHRTAIYVAAILGLAAMVGHSGLGTVVGNQLLAVVPLDPAAPFRSFAALAGISAVFSFLVTANSVPALFTPLAQSLSDASGLPLLTVIMIQVVGYSAPLLPYQASPIVVAMQMGQVPLRPAMRLSALICAITFLVLLPIDYVWFLLLGWVGD